MATVSKDIWVGIDDQRIKLEGEKLQKYLAQQELDLAEQESIKAEQVAKTAQREAALAKLAALGLTADDLLALGL